MESQNHFYGHSAALARYSGYDRARHIHGLVQHGWTVQSPVSTHFRDFPELGRSASAPRLLVWTHDSRAWTPDEGEHTVPIGAPFLYRVANRSLAEPSRGTLFVPVHGIETQALDGDHRAAARDLLDREGPSTVCVYWADLRREGLLEAYTAAGHRCVTLGQRTAPEFLDRLVTLLLTHRRVVSNRLTTPVLYAAWLGRDVAVYGDPMQLEGERSESVDAVARRWPEFYGTRSSPDVRAIAAEELGEKWLRQPQELRRLLGWDKAIRIGPFARHWVTSPLRRAMANIGRRSGVVPDDSASESAGISWQWIRAAASYLPRPIGRVDPRHTHPLSISSP